MTFEEFKNLRKGDKIITKVNIFNKKRYWYHDNIYNNKIYTIESIRLSNNHSQGYIYPQEEIPGIFIDYVDCIKITFSKKIKYIKDFLIDN